MNPTTVDHVEIQVDDVSKASDLCHNVLGLAKVSAADGNVYFGCGRDDSFDLAIAEGTPGLDHVALHVGGPSAVETQTRQLADAGLTTTDVDDPAPLARADRAPVALDHVNITTPAVRDDTELLTEVVGLRLSEVVGSHEPSGLHHIAWEYRGLEHRKQLIDRLAASDTPLERGIGRHYAGNNLYSYFRSPGGHRMEILAEMARVHTTAVSYVQDYESASVAWGADPPDTFSRVSGIVGGVEPGG